ncbi:membrane-targeted effector domain-containing toxin, partial [Photobacterium marinum]|uniref:membrane-targeted effector domain-containing toxin n=1 Tax=Photobacterium marinum TaxID=1056511 RepID=UPI000566D4A5
TKNCSTTVAKVLKAGGADKLIGHTWTPNVGIWTPKALFKYGQALQEAQLEIAAKKENRQAVGELEALSGKSKQVETVTIDTEDTDKTKIDSQRNAFERKLRESMPFYSLRSERNMLVQEGEAGFEVRAWPGNGDEAKLIFVEDPDDTDQIKSVERFILANYDSYEQLPDKLFQVNEKVISHHDGRTRILAQKVEGAWQYNLKSELMSVSELLDSAYVKGKVRGESYQNVVDALADYHAAIQDTPDHDAIDILTNLRKQVEGYVLGHPDSGRLPAMKSLLSQIEVRIDESSALMAASDESMKSPG